MRYAVIDTEYTTRCPIESHKGHHMWPGNTLVTVGVHWVGFETPKMNDDTAVYDGSIMKYVPDSVFRADLVVGQNIKVDLLQLMHLENMIGRTLTPGNIPQIWDTQLAEYLLTGQQHLYASLDELAVKYGGTLKDDFFKKLWDEGMDTEDMLRLHRERFIDYQKADVTNTHIVFKAQMLEAQRRGMMPLMQAQMEALRATTIAAYNGMKVDVAALGHQRSTLAAHIGVLQRVWDSAVTAFVPTHLFHKQPSWNWASTKDLSYIFFGGTYKYTEKEMVGKYKNGKDKYKLVEKEFKWPALADPARFGSTKNANGYWTVDEAVLKNIKTNWATSIWADLADSVLKLREENKQLSTYFDGLQNHTMPNGFVYPNLGHCGTVTGRLNANHPNMQNQTSDAPIKECFVSRFEHGSLMEFDYSQLEMVALAYLADDKVLIDDINSGRDMHMELYKEMYGRYPTKEERKPFKRLSFGLVYGAGYKTLAENAEVGEDVAKKFIKVFYGRYKGVEAWHMYMQELAKAQRKLTGKHDADSKKPYAEFTYTMPHGRHWVFREYPSSYRAGTMSFSPTQLKNYPVQGFATGDIVPMMVGQVVRKLEELKLDDNIKFIMTVHDSLVFDVAAGFTEQARTVIKEVLESAPDCLKAMFGIDFPMQLKCGVSIGPNWRHMKEIE